jgi:hypothetical protein
MAPACSKEIFRAQVLSYEEAAKLLGVSKATLERLVAQNTGPPRIILSARKRRPGGGGAADVFGNKNVPQQYIRCAADGNFLVVARTHRPIHQPVERGPRPVGRAFLTLADGNPERVTKVLDSFADLDRGVVAKLGGRDWADPPLWRAPQ